MFDKVRFAVSSITKATTEKTISQNQLNKIMEEFEIQLLESEIAFDLVKKISDELKIELGNKSISRKTEIAEVIKEKIRNSIQDIFEKCEVINLIELIKSSSVRPFKVLTIGINGSGKTTTVAKIAYLLKKNNLGVVIVAADTFRAGAIEQLKEHSEKLDVKLIAQKYGADPAAVARDGVNYAESHNIDVVLIDTSGRVQTSKNLMQEITKIESVINPDYTIFIGDSLTGNDLLSQAEEFYKYAKFNGAILTKTDANTKGGAMLSILSTTGKPIIYIGTGQNYKDLEQFNIETFLANLFHT